MVLEDPGTVVRDQTDEQAMRAFAPLIVDAVDEWPRTRYNLTCTYRAFEIDQ